MSRRTTEPEPVVSADDAADAPAWLTDPDRNLDAAELDLPTDRLLAAALSAFAEFGYHGTTTRDITGRAGLSPAALYVHFPSKMRILSVLALETHKYVYRHLQAEVSRHADPLSQLEAVVRWHVRFHVESATAARVANYELNALDVEEREAVLEVRRAIGKLVTDVLRKGRQSGQFALTDITTTGIAILSLSIDVSRWRQPTSRLTGGRLADAYWELVSRIVAPSIPAG